MEHCCRIFARSATLQCWWIILHPANWKASLSFMSALCWFTIKTYRTVLWVEGPALRELAKSKNEDEADMCTYALGSFFLQPMRKSVSYIYMSRIYLCLWFRFMVPKPLYLCPLSRSVPLRFYVNFSYQRFSLWGLAVLCEWLDGHSSLFLSRTHTRIHPLSLSLHHTQGERWLMCGWSVWGARAAGAGRCWQYVKWCGTPGRTSPWQRPGVVCSLLKGFQFEELYFTRWKKVFTCHVKCHDNKYNQWNIQTGYFEIQCTR